MEETTQSISCTVNMQWIGQALRQYYKVHGRLPGSLNELIPEYLSEIPACPSAGRDTYSMSYHIEKDLDETAAVLYCSGNQHGEPEMPRYRLRIFKE